MQLLRASTGAPALKVVIALVICSQALTACIVPVVTPTLNALPSDPQKRSEYLETTKATPGPEMRTSKPSRASKVEIALAIVAALLAGHIAANAFDTAEAKAVFGLGISFDETGLFGKGAGNASNSERIPVGSNEEGLDAKKELPPWLPNVE